MLPYRQTLTRILNELLDFLRQLPEQPVPAVHGARKRTKQLRALLRFQQTDGKPADRQLKSISHLLAPLREAHVDRETLQNLIVDSPELQTLSGKVDLYQYLSMSAVELSHHDSRYLQTAGLQLQQAFQRLPLHIPRQLLAENLVHSFDRAAAKFSEILSDPTPETLHSWRKRVKRLWYQERFAADTRFTNMTSPIAQSDDLASILGEIHDLDSLLLHFPVHKFPELHREVSRKRSQLTAEAHRQGTEMFISGKTTFLKQLLQQKVST